MSILLSVKDIEKTMGSKLLFEQLSFGISEGEKIGLIGPNGSGKSTLLKILAQLEKPDRGEISQKKNIRVTYVAQKTEFNEDEGLSEYLSKYLSLNTEMDSLESEVQASIFLNIVGFEDVQVKIKTLSGGWRKRLAIAMAIAQDPDLLILDEPTNHMDWDGILWLESWLSLFKKALVLVSHDRTFLEKTTRRIMEINRLYSEGYLSFDCHYTEFLEKKEQYIQSQTRLQESLSNKARREVEWLRAGVKARTTKSQSRADQAHALIDQLQDIKSRNLSGTRKSKIDIESAGKRSKKYIELKEVSVSYGELKLLNNINLTLGPKSCLGILGRNGSGKTSLLKVIDKKASNYTGEVFWADDLKMVYFDQKRESLSQEINLVEYLGEGSDHVLFNGNSIHVASYASRFLFASEKMYLKISQLSGGEQARLLIAKLLLQPADVLILDEPTNDLDIETIEILEEALSSFSGLVLLVSHDRTFMECLCHKFLALEGHGAWELYADIHQWLRSQFSSEKSRESSKEIKNEKENTKKVKLSYKEKKQLETIEEDIQQAETALKGLQDRLEDPEISSHAKSLQEAFQDVADKEKEIELLYTTWEALEEKKKLMGK